MAAQPPQLWTLGQFQAHTGGVGRFRPGRGLLSIIDDQLIAWNGGNCVGRRKKVLSRILRACRYWLEQKQGKGTNLANARRMAVNTLAGQAFARLQYQKFEAHKQGGAPGQSRPLQGGYAHERGTYLTSGKTQALSGSTASALIRNAPVIGIANAPNFGTMTEDQFRQLINTYAPEMLMETEVVFFSKSERMGRMMIVRKGRLHMGPGQLFDTQDAEWAWAMDTYGNFFSTNQDVESASLGAHQRFNHSSLNAGKDVTCAGIVKAARGYLTYLDNASGHYKPRRADVARALSNLENDGYDFGANVCGVRIMEMVNGNMQWSIYRTAQTLLRNQNAPPDAVG